MLQNLSAVNAALEGIINGIDEQNVAQIESSAGQLSRAGKNLITYSNIDITGMLQKSSMLHKQIVKLESEKPTGI